MLQAIIAGARPSFHQLGTILCCSWIAWLAGPYSLGQEIREPDRDWKLNQIQVIGSHNSYHLAPLPKVMDWIALTGKQVAQSIDYSHPPLEVQFSELGIRQIELDVFADPDGGLYANPAVWKWTGGPIEDSRMTFDFASVMKAPGFKILHAPGFDYATNTPTLSSALQVLSDWSHAHPGHIPIMVLLELKSSAPSFSGVKPVAFDALLLRAMDQAIVEAIPSNQRLAPDDVRGRKATLREAVLESGWPTLEAAKGKLLFALDNTDSIRERYLDGNASLEGRPLFVSVEATEPAAAWTKINDPIGDYELIRSLVKRGFMVRTRADADTRAARTGDTTMRDRALSSGAQFISTDYPIPDPRFTDYCVQLEGRAIYQRNPVSHP